jgi:hypothetical protein
MSSKPNPKRSKSASGAAGVKMLITAASLTAVIGGWASFTARGAGAQLPEQNNNEEAIDDNHRLTVDLSPLPTLIPEPSPVPTLRVVTGLPSSTSRVVASPGSGLPAPTPVAAKDSSAKGKGSSSKGAAPKESSKPPKPDPVSNTRSSK